jgi:hypothetical protein
MSASNAIDPASDSTALRNMPLIPVPQNGPKRLTSVPVQHTPQAPTRTYIRPCSTSCHGVQEVRPQTTCSKSSGAQPNIHQAMQYTMSCSTSGTTTDDSVANPGPVKRADLQEVGLLGAQHGAKVREAGEEVSSGPRVVSDHLTQQGQAAVRFAARDNFAGQGLVLLHLVYEDGNGALLHQLRYHPAPLPRPSLGFPSLCACVTSLTHPCMRARARARTHARTRTHRCKAHTRTSERAHSDRHTRIHTRAHTHTHTNSEPALHVMANQSRHRVSLQIK